MASNNALSTALAMASSKTNWTAIVPARAPPPPPPITQATMLKRTHEIQCGKCAMSDYAENIGVWNDDGTLQELGLCGECEEDKAQCVLCSKWAVSATMSYDDAVGEHSCCDCDPNGDVLLGEEVCSICGEEGEVGTITVCGRDIKVCENCDTDGDNYDGFLDKYEFCAETSSYEEKEEEYICDCSVCGERLYACGPIEIGDDGDCGGCCKGCEPTPLGVGCCEKCELEVERDCDEHDNCHIIDGGDAADKFRCQRCLVDCPCDECEEE